MYADEKNIQILIGVLKGHRIKRAVLSPGGSDAPIVQSFQHDRFFECYSAADERNAVYFAIGIARVTREPVVCVCTAGTAVSNYLPGMTEAFYQNLPVVAVTADSSPYLLGQLELQKISQEQIFNGVIKKQVTLPAVRSETDAWACNRMINEAVLELSHHGSGPVHINVQITQTLGCSTHTIPKQRVIRRHQVSEADYENLHKRLTGKKVMAVAGQGLTIDEKFLAACARFYETYDSMFAVETVSNLQCPGAVSVYPLTETGAVGPGGDFVPDIVISIGNHTASYQLKQFLREHHKSIENWQVHESGEVRDPFWCCSDIFEGEAGEFFERLPACSSTQNRQNRHVFFSKWQRLYHECDFQTKSFSSLGIARILSQTMPEGSILHTAVLNSTRVMQFSDYLEHKKVQYFCNLGALGIDGCTAAFLGEAAASDSLAYLLTGDLSFFYGMNAIGMHGVKNNVRIVLLNNGGGEEFKIKMDYPDIEEFVCAENKLCAKGWALECGFSYFTASDYEQTKKILDTFSRPSEKPVFLEIFLDMDTDAQVIREMYHKNRMKHPGQVKQELKSSIKNAAGKLLSEKSFQKAKEIYEAIRS